jgi:hypothetical protein
MERQDEMYPCPAFLIYVSTLARQRVVSRDSAKDQVYGRVVGAARTTCHDTVMMLCSAGHWAYTT